MTKSKLFCMQWNPAWLPPRGLAYYFDGTLSDGTFFHCNQYVLLCRKATLPPIGRDNIPKRFSLEAFNRMLHPSKYPWLPVHSLAFVELDERNFAVEVGKRTCCSFETPHSTTFNKVYSSFGVCMKYGEQETIYVSENYLLYVLYTCSPEKLCFWTTGVESHGIKVTTEREKLVGMIGVIHKEPFFDYLLQENKDETVGASGVRSSIGKNKTTVRARKAGQHH